MKYFLAVDGGGTKTHVLCATDAGEVIGEGLSGPTNLTATTAGAASYSLREGIRQALEKAPADIQIEALVMGLAGLDTPTEQSTAEKVFGQVLQGVSIKKIQLVNDIVIALENGTQAPNALALISGTGSSCFGRNAQGQTAKAGGLDYLLTDQGSGYAIGRAVLRQAVKSFDGRHEKTMLEQFVCEHFHITSLAELKDKVHNPLLTKTEIAELAEVCLRAFDQGDSMAQAIFDYAVGELIIMAQAVMRRLELLEQPYDCVLVGSITRIMYIEEKLVVGLKAINSKINCVSPTQPPVYGALKLAIKNSQ